MPFEGEPDYQPEAERDLDRATLEVVRQKIAALAVTKTSELLQRPEDTQDLAMAYRMGKSEGFSDGLHAAQEAVDQLYDQSP